MRLLRRAPQATDADPEFSLPLACYHSCNIGFLGYQAQNRSYECLSSPFADYNQDCFACLQKHNRNPINDLDALRFGEFLAYCDVRTECPVKYYPCMDIGLAGAGTCCRANEYCVPDLGNPTKVTCCEIGTGCDRTCPEYAYACTRPVPVTFSGTVASTLYTACCTRNTQYAPSSSTTTVEYSIASSWLTTSTTVSAITLSGVGLDSISSITTVPAAAVVMVATRTDWTGFPQGTSTGGSGTAADGGGGWIVGPVISAIATLTALVGIAFLFLRGRKQPRGQEEEGEAWSGKPELHGEGLSSVSPQELDAEYYAKGQQADHQMAQMAANEVAALEMDVEAHHHEMDAEPHHWELDSPDSGKGSECK